MFVSLCTESREGEYCTLALSLFLQIRRVLRDYKLYAKAKYTYVVYVEYVVLRVYIIIYLYGCARCSLRCVFEPYLSVCVSALLFASVDKKTTKMYMTLGYLHSALRAVLFVRPSGLHGHDA